MTDSNAYGESRETGFTCASVLVQLVQRELAAAASGRSDLDEVRVEQLRAAAAYADRLVDQERAHVS